MLPRLAVWLWVNDGLSGLGHPPPHFVLCLNSCGSHQVAPDSQASSKNGWLPVAEGPSLSLLGGTRPVGKEGMTAGVAVHTRPEGIVGKREEGNLAREPVFHAPKGLN